MFDRTGCGAQVQLQISVLGAPEAVASSHGVCERLVGVPPWARLLIRDRRETERATHALPVWPASFRLLPAMRLLWDSIWSKPSWIEGRSTAASEVDVWSWRERSRSADSESAMVVCGRSVWGWTTLECHSVKGGDEGEGRELPTVVQLLAPLDVDPLSPTPPPLLCLLLPALLRKVLQCRLRPLRSSPAAPRALVPLAARCCSCATRSCPPSGEVSERPLLCLQSSSLYRQRAGAFEQKSGSQGMPPLSARPPAPQRLTCADRLHISALDTAHCSRHAQWQTNRRAGGGPLRGDGDAGEPQGDVRRGPLWLASAPLTTLPKVQKCAELYSRCHAGGPLACRGPTWLDVSSFDSLLCLLRAHFRFEWPSPRFHS